MQRKLTIVLLTLVMAFFAMTFISRKYFYKPVEKKQPATVVVPKNQNDKSGNSTDSSVLMDDSTITSLIPLKTTETLISIVSMDFNDDGFDDQINAIKTLGSPYLSLLVGLYNPKTSKYERNSIISTEITQVQTFSYTGLDLTGTHRTALVYQGFAENGDSILQAFFVSNKDKFTLKRIADFRGDGTIFIQQLDRYDAYERSNAKGASFPIWVYSSDTETNSSDQLQVRYDWNEGQGIYTQTQVIRMAGSRIAAKELAKIQDGTVKTFAKHLNGLWYKGGDGKTGLRYLFFDYENSEIVFLLDDTEEVYKWAHSTIRRNGIYITAINQQIENLQRRIDISLRGIDEIHIRIQDDVRMLISESTVWDGGYKKMPQNASLYLQKHSNKVNQKGSDLESEPFWRTSDNSNMTAIFKNGSYTIVNESISETGLYTEYTILNEPFVQFRSESEKSFLEEFYKVTVTEHPETKEKMIILHPYKAQGNGIYPLEKKKLSFIAVSEQK